MAGSPQGPYDTNREKAQGEPRVFFTVLLLGLLLIPAALGLSSLFSIKLEEFFNADLFGVFAGAAATVPLLIFLRWFMTARCKRVAELRAAQLSLLANIGFRLTRARILLLSLAAGLGEEMMFRGVLQTAISHQSTPVTAIALSSILFGALHARSVLYAFIAGVVGAYLGILFWLTGNLAIPIITHALYDFAALEVARRALSPATPQRL